LAGVETKTIWQFESSKFSEAFED